MRRVHEARGGLPVAAVPGPEACPRVLHMRVHWPWVSPGGSLGVDHRPGGAPLRVAVEDGVKEDSGVTGKWFGGAEAGSRGGEGSRAEQTLRELQRICSLLEQVVVGQVVGNQQLSWMSLHLEIMAERGDGAWAMPSTPGGNVPGTPTGSAAEEDSEVDTEELEREVEDLGQEAENPEQELEVEGKGKDRAQ